MEIYVGERTNSPGWSRTQPVREYPVGEYPVSEE